MISKLVNYFLTLLVFTTCFSHKAEAKETQLEEHTKVCMRMIGHEILLQAGDSTSRILPIEKDIFRYRIKFENEFGFEPDQLGSTVNRIMDSCLLAKRYIVEVVECESNLVVYSYQIGHLTAPDMMPCKGRIQPIGCYYLLISILDYNPPLTEAINEERKEVITPPQKEGNNGLMLFMLIGTLLIFVGVFVFRSFKKNSSSSPQQLHIIQLGDFEFDQRNMMLSHQGNKVELTSKESDLLTLLYNCVNDTIEREVILKKVWGDEGDYIGRTLDVFISKLRKKLDADSNIKIVNIRGVGYKMILNEP